VYADVHIVALFADYRKSWDCTNNLCFSRMLTLLVTRNSSAWMRNPNVTFCINDDFVHVV